MIWEMEPFLEAMKTLPPGGGTTTNVATPTSVAPIPTVTNDLPHKHPERIFEGVEHAGMVTFWIVFAVMALSSLAFIFMAYKTPVEKRLFHVLTAFITVFATISYYAMATGGGQIWVHLQEKTHNVVYDKDEILHIYRQFFYARYLDWTLTTPLLILDLAFLAGLSGSAIIVAVVADLIMIMTGLFAALSDGGSKWGYYIMAWVAFIVIIYLFFTAGRKSVQNRTADTKKLFNYLGIFTLILWLGYPIVWILGEGVRKFSVDGEIIAYAVLDILAKPVFGFWLLLSHARLTGQLCLHDGFWNRGLSTQGGVRLGEDDDDEA